ncbi:unnamed protein product, partial [Symbiodinium microadriaticum]
EFCSTMQSLPSPPPLVFMDGFTNALVFDDTLHVAWRGFAADFLASCLILIFGKGVGLQRACENAGLWARARGYSLSIDEFSLSDDKFPSVNAKGYEIKICCTWLAAWLQSMLSATLYWRYLSLNFTIDAVWPRAARALAINISILE